MDKSKIKGLAVAIPIVIIAIFLVGEEKKFEEQRASEKNVIDEKSEQKTTEKESSEISQESLTPITTTDEKCNSSYPDVCISSWPPDLDCSEIVHNNFRVLQPDPHEFDQDNDGIGCE